MDLALIRLQTCHMSRNCLPADTPRGQVRVQATAAANPPPLTLAQRTLLQTAARRKQSQQGSQGAAVQQQPQLLPELRANLFNTHQLANSSPEEFDQLMAEHERQLRLRQQLQQHQQHQLTMDGMQPRARRTRAPTRQQQPATQQPAQLHQQQPQPPQQQLAASTSSSAAAPADQLQQMQLLQQQLALRQVLAQQQQRKRRLQLQLRREPAVLTALIKRSRSWSRVGQLFRSFTPLFNPIHVSTAITHLAQLQDRPLSPQQLAAAPQGFQELVQDLTGAVVACTPDLGPRQLANSLWAVSRLGADGLLTRKQRSAFMAAFVDKVQYAAPQHVAIMAAAVANMRWAHCPEWGMQLVEAAQTRMPYFRPPELAILLHALARLDAPLPADWLSSFLATCHSNLHSLTLQELSMLGVSLARLQYRPDQEWLAAYLQAVQVAMSPAAAPGAPGTAGAWQHALAHTTQQQQHHETQGHTAAIDCSSSSSAVWEPSTAASSWEEGHHSGSAEQDAGVEGVPPGGHFAADFTGVQGIVNTVWALAKLQAVPPGHWQARCFAALHLLTRDLSMQGVSTLLWSFAKLGVQLPSDLLLRLLTHTRRPHMLPAANATDVAMLAWALGTMGVTAAGLEAATASAMPAGNSSSSSSSGASVHERRGFRWLQDFVYHSFRVLPTASAADLSSLLVGVVRMRLSPGPDWTGLVLVEAVHRLPHMTHVQLTSTLLSLARLRCEPSHSSLEAFCTRSEQLLAATAAAGGRARRACRRSQQPDQEEGEPTGQREQQQQQRGASSDAAAFAAQTATQFYTPQSLANTLGALAMFGHCPPQQWRSSFFAASAALLPCFSGRDLAYTIWALALLEAGPPPRAWMDAYLVALRTHVPTMTSQQLSAVIWALARLNHRPGADWMNRFLDRVARLTPEPGSNGSSSGRGEGGSSGEGSAPGGGVAAPPSPLQLSGYFSGIILQGLTGWACRTLDLGFDGSSSAQGGSGHGAEEQHGSARVIRRRAVRKLRRSSTTPADCAVEDGFAGEGGAVGGSDAAGAAAAPGVLHSRTVASDGSITFRF